MSRRDSRTNLNPLHIYCRLQNLGLPGKFEYDTTVDGPLVGLSIAF